MQATFCLSSDLFNGFKVSINKDTISDMDMVIDAMKKQLTQKLEEIGLYTLSEKARLKNFHVHSYRFEDVLSANDDKIWYICDHC